MCALESRTSSRLLEASKVERMVTKAVKVRFASS